jgi:hypothetical protein
MAKDQSIFKYSLLEILIFSAVVIVASFFTYKFGMEKQMDDYSQNDNNFSSNANVTRQGNTQIQAGNMSINRPTGNVNRPAISSPTPTPDLSDLDFDLPYAEGIVEDLILYESDGEELDENQRKYGKVFFSSSTRYINATLIVRQYNRTTDFNSVDVFFYGNNVLKDKCSETVEELNGITASSYSKNLIEDRTDSKGRAYLYCHLDLSGCGNKKFGGSWLVGTGRVEVKLKDRILISKNFEVR